jgi:Protein of unknown function (DUF3822)
MDTHKVFKITDDRFSVDLIDQHDLVFELNLSRFRFIIKNNHTNTVIWLEDYYLGLHNTLEKVIESVTEIIKKHEFLVANFWKSLKVLSQNPFFCTVPQELYEESQSDNYLTVLFPDLDSNLFLIEARAINNSEDYFISAFPKTLISFFETMYPQKQIDYKFSIFEVLNLFNNDKQFEAKNLFLFDDIYINTLFISTITNKLVIENLNLDSKNLNDFLLNVTTKGNANSLLFGEITPFSKNYKQISQITKAIAIGKTPLKVKLSQYFVEVTDHRYLTLFVC